MPQTANVFDGPITEEDALRFAGTHNEEGRELNDAERAAAAARITEAAAQNAQWKQSISGLNVGEQIAILAQPTVQDHRDAEENTQENTQESGAPEAPGAEPWRTRPPRPWGGQ